ncbi:MAG: leucine-rich repeat protein, partial [Tenericutes bacterium]|nr:leucine-rich repeat protein [Mycoplasmatota bacterium]
MRKNHVFLVLISIFLTFALFSCNDSTDINPVSIEINESTVSEQYDPDTFDLSTISLTIIYDDESTSQISLNESMLSQEDLALLSTLGLKELQVQYLGLTATLSINFVYDELKTKLLFIYQLALPSDDVPATYEAWLESISGEDGLSITDASLNYLGHLILTFSDLSTQDVGQVIGTDGKEVELQATSTSIEWRYTDDLEWQELITLAQITGIGISLVEINNDGELIITYTDDQTTNLGVIFAHKVKFMGHNGQLIDIVWVTNGQDAIAPNPPLLTGYTFSEWDEIYTGVNSNLVINAIYIQNSYDVEFISDTTTDYPSIQDIPYGSTIILPTPDKLDYIFIGWFTDIDDPSSQIFSTTSITEDLILLAKYEKQSYVVQFIDYDDSLLSHQIVPYMTSAVPPMLPDRIGYEFIGWNQDFLEVTADITCKAVYTQQHYNIVFLANGGNDVESINNLSYNDVLNLPTPVYEDYDFLGWYTYGNLIESGDTMPDKDLLLFAKWEPHEYLLSFDSNSGSVVSNQTYYIYDDIQTLPTPTKAGYTFIGWEQDSEFITAPFSWEVHTDINVTAIWEGVTDDIIYRLNDGYAKVLGIQTPILTLIIPDTIYDIPVTHISENAFLDNDSIIEASAGLNISHVEDNAFNGSTALTSITFKNTTTNFGVSVFEGCTSITSITISSEMNYTLKYFFGDLVPNIPASLEIVRYSLGSSFIDSTLFTNDMNGVTLGLASDMTTISANQFKDTQYLLSVELPNNLIRIEDSAFENSGLQSIEIPNTVVSIGRGAFKDCGGMLSLTFEESSVLQLIEYQAFRLTGITGTITIPASVSSIESQGLAYIYNLEHIIFETGSQLTFISNYMLFSNTNLISVTLPDQLTDIGLYSFATNGNLEEIIIPSSVTWVGNNAFFQCDSLSIYARAASLPETWDEYFNPSNRPIYWSFEDFAEDTNFEYILQSNGNALLVGRKAGSVEANLTIPKLIESHTLVEIMYKAFE